MTDLEALYRNRLPEFCRVATAIAGSRDLGEDAVQDAFAKAVRRRRSYRGRGTLEAWVWRIVVNAARDARRRSLRAQSVAEPAPADPFDPPSLPLDVLTDHQREVLFLHYFADLDYATIGAALAISPGTVGAILSTARRRLRQALTQEVHA